MQDDDVSSSSCFPATDFAMEIIGWSCAVLSVVTQVFNFNYVVLDVLYILDEH